MNNLRRRNELMEEREEEPYLPGEEIDRPFIHPFITIPEVGVFRVNEINPDEFLIGFEPNDNLLNFPIFREVFNTINDLPFPLNEWDQLIISQDMKHLTFFTHGENEHNHPDVERVYYFPSTNEDLESKILYRMARQLREGNVELWGV